MSGCARPPGLPGPTPSFHLSEVAREGDGRRRASTDLVLQALDAEVRGDARRARGLLARSLQTDASNPYAFLALARHHAEQGEPDPVIEHLARVEDLLSDDALRSPRVEVHLIGLRGVAFELEGRPREARVWLARAARIAPSVWGDGQLSAGELR